MKIALLADDLEFVTLMATYYSPRGFPISHCQKGEELPSDTDLILLDLAQKEISAIEQIRELKNRHPNLPIIVMTASSAAETEIESTAAFVSGYAVKPPNFPQLTFLFRRVLDFSALEKENQHLRESMNANRLFAGKIGPLEDLETEYIQEVLRRCEGVKDKAAKVLKIDRKTLYRKLQKLGKCEADQASNFSHP
ncbi:MAG: response regulator [Bdellovibrionales bacterium]|nr:response regulator [Bdellovibrionales bacterium]